MITREGAEAGELPALARLISVTPRAFATRYWGTHPLLSRHTGPFDDLFTLADADRLTGKGGFGDPRDSARAPTGSSTGSVILLPDLHRTWAPIAAFSRLLTAELAALSRVEACLAAAFSPGGGPDYDLHDAFVIQIHGERHWSIRPPVHENPLADEAWTDHREEIAARARELPTIEQTLRPGDVLYVPRGWIHSTVATGKSTLHLTVSVAPFTHWDIARQLITAATEDAALRVSLPLGLDLSDVDALLPHVHEVESALARVLAHPDLRAMASSLASVLASATRPPPVSQPVADDWRETLHAGTRVGWRPGLDAELQIGRELVTIVFADRRVTLPIEAREAIVALYAGLQLAGALPGLDPDYSLVVVRRLIREAVLVIS